MKLCPGCESTMLLVDATMPVRVLLVYSAASEKLEVEESAPNYDAIRWDAESFVECVGCGWNGNMAEVFAGMLARGERL